KAPKKPEFTSKELTGWKDQVENYEEYKALEAKLVPEAKVKEKNIDAALKVERKAMKRFEEALQHASRLDALTRMLPEDLQPCSRDALTASRMGLEDQLAALKEKMQHSSDIVNKYSEIEIQ